MICFRSIDSYGAYHSIDSAGRADVVLEGAANMQGPWVEIPFRYKTGDVEVKPSFISNFVADIFFIK